MTMASTRNQIIAFLEKRGPTSASELANALKLTPANIRHHLRVLLREGLIVAIQRSQTTQRGRPAYLFGLSEQQKAHNLPRLCAALLQQVLSDTPPEEKNATLQSVAHYLVSDSLPSGKTTLTQRLIFTTKILNDMHYQASWEAHPKSPTIRFSHCPYATLVDRFPELCQLDVHLLEWLMQCPIEIEALRQQSPSGSTFCRFRLAPPLR